MKQPVQKCLNLINIFVIHGLWATHTCVESADGNTFNKVHDSQVTK